MTNNTSGIKTEILKMDRSFTRSQTSSTWAQLWQTRVRSLSFSPGQHRRQHLEWQSQDTTDEPPCHVHLPVCLWIIDPHKGAPKKNTSHGNEVLPQDTSDLIQRPCYQRGSPCQGPAGNRTTRKSPGRRKETQTEVEQTFLPVIRSAKTIL